MDVRRKRFSHMKVNVREIPPDLVSDILMRVPTRSFGSIRSVCKLWRSTSRDPTFIRNHFDRAAAVSELGPRRPLVVALLRNGEGSKGGSLISFSPYDADAAIRSTGEISSDMVKTIALPADQEYHLSSSCNGLLLLYDTLGGFIIVNPITGEQPKVPSPPSLHITIPEVCTPKYSMGFEPHSNKYKIVRIFCSCSYPVPKYNMEVHTLGTKKWRQLCSMAEMPDTVATVDGVMYWGINKTRQILSVDLSTEAVGTIPLPIQGGDFLLGELQGCLSCTYKQLTERSVIVWLRKLKDDMSYEWRYQFWVPILAAGLWGDAPAGQPKWAAPMAIYEGSFILLKTATCLFFFDLRIGRFRILYRNEAMDEVQLHVDSLFSAEGRSRGAEAVLWKKGRDERSSEPQISQEVSWRKCRWRGEITIPISIRRVSSSSPKTSEHTERFFSFFIFPPSLGARSRDRSQVLELAKGRRKVSSTMSDCIDCR